MLVAKVKLSGDKSFGQIEVDGVGLVGVCKVGGEWAIEWVNYVDHQMFPPTKMFSYGMKFATIEQLRKSVQEYVNREVDRWRLIHEVEALRSGRPFPPL